MSSDSAVPLVLVALFVVAFLAMGALVVVLLVHTLGKVSRHGSVAGAMYDGRVGHVYGELESAPRGIAKVRVKVVGVDRDPPGVGIEVHVNARLGHHMRAVRLTPEEAHRIAEALERAAAG